MSINVDNLHSMCLSSDSINMVFTYIILQIFTVMVEADIWSCWLVVVMPQRYDKIGPHHEKIDNLAKTKHFWFNKTLKLIS